ncbi:MAG: hypothetical protein ACPGJP_01030, partial [Hyphomicrobiales bacterium]
YSMLNTAKNFLSEVVSLGLLLIAVGVVLQVIFGSAVPFVGGDIVGNLTNLIGSLGEGGLVGLISIGIILYLIQRA